MQTIKLTEIKDFFQVRKFNENFIEYLVKEFTEKGFNSAYPVSVSSDGILWDGNHRYEAAKQAGLTEIPAIIETPDNLRFAAHERNRVAVNALPETFVDHAEEIWALLAEGKTQQQVADELNTSKQRISQYAALQNICPEAWGIVSTTLSALVDITEDGSVVKKSTTVDFSERLLRDITMLTPDQQFELVSDLASEKINKSKFKSQAEAYKTRNKLTEQLKSALSGVSDENLVTEAVSEIESGRYDKTGIETLIQSVIDTFQKKNSIRLINGDFYEEVKKIQSGSVDLILTDPPYNIANENEHVYEGRQNVSKDFGEWDKHDHADFIKHFDTWASEFSRVMADNSSGYVFTSDRYITHLRDALEKAGLHYRATLIWHKTNPGTSPAKRNFISSVEYIAYFIKGSPVFNFTDDNDMHNFIEYQVCAGNERLKDKKGNTLHPTQKPKAVIRKLMEISSNKGQTVFDGFMGVGTTCRVARETGRKFIGIELEKQFFERCGE